MSSKEMFGKCLTAIHAGGDGSKFHRSRCWCDANLESIFIVRADGKSIKIWSKERQFND